MNVNEITKLVVWVLSFQ